MKKTISVTLGGRAYTVEESAYQILDAYLTRLKHHFAQDPSVQELLADIELSIADKFSERIDEQKNVITETDVSEVIAVMGEVNEIDSEEPASDTSTGKEDPSPKDQPTAKHLYRDGDNMVIAGVCSGLAAYFGVDPVFIRITFVVLAFVNGIGILAYFLLWIAIPLAITSAQKLEMRGKPINLTEIEELIREKAQHMGSEGKAAVERLKIEHSSILRRTLNLPVVIIGTIWNGIKRLLYAIGPIVSILIGSFVILGSTLALTATSVITSILLFRDHAPDIITDIPLRDLAQGPWYYIGIVSLATLALIPLIFLITLGVSFITRKNQFRLLVSGILLSLWVVAAGTGATAAMHVGPKVQEQVDTYLQEQTVTRSYDVANFQRIELTGRERFTIKQGDVFAIQVTGLKNELENIEMHSENGVLKINERNRANHPCLFCVRRHLEGIITLPRLDMLQVSGSSRTVLQNLTHDVSLEVSDIASVDMFGLGQHVTTTVEGAGRVTLSGSLNSLRITTKDVGRVFGEELTMQATHITQLDASRVELRGTTLDFEASLKDISRLEASEFTSERAVIMTRDNAHAEIMATKSLTATSTDASRIEYEETNASTTLRTLNEGRVQSSNDSRD